MRMTTLATVVSSILLGAAVAHAGDTKAITPDQFKAADKNGDGLITLTEAQASMPTLAAHFASADSNGDGKISADELTAYNKSMEADQATSPPAK
jgi:hypothetical protein